MQCFTIGPEHYARHAHDLAVLAAFNRVNALSCIKSAEHGWLGASFSVAEIMTTLYFGLGETNVVLSKGHAAAMQYACLHGKGLMSREALLAYKDGPKAPQAHPDRATPGILINTGSLGQALSKVAGLAWARPTERFTVILGDGELQEGQCFEALQTLSHRRLTNVTVVVDLNAFQSKLPVASIKAIPDLARVFEGFGFAVQSIDGHDPAAFIAAWGRPADRPRAILARTVKAGGTKLLPSEGATQPWHGRIPDDRLYLELVTEQLAKARDPQIEDELATFQRTIPQAPAASPGTNAAARGRAADGSTRTAFARRLTELLLENSELVVLDADLADSCGLADLVGHPRFLEMGISEADMVSFAGGLALHGKLPVVNTYAAFFKRACEQVYLNATEGSKVIYAGHYAGIDYTTDGKTHQSLSDLSLMRAIPGVVVLEPATPEATGPLLDWAVREAVGPVYLRLHRTPTPLALPAEPVRVDRPLTARDGGRHLLISMGPQATGLALETLATPALAGWGLLVQSALNGPVDRDFWRNRLEAAETVVTVEEDLAPGALFAWTADLLGSLGISPRLHGKALHGFGASFRTLAACREHFGFTPAALLRELERAGLTARA